MNTRYYIFAALILGLAACNKIDEKNLTNGPVAAEINANIGSAVTRTTDNEWDNGDAIGVTCVADNGGKTNYVNSRYQWNGSQFKSTDAAQTIYFQDNEPVVFTAYYPYSGDPNVAQKPVSIDTNTDQTDYLFASGATGSFSVPQVNFVDTNEGEGTYDPAKDHSFQHVMSRLTLNFQT